MPSGVFFSQLSNTRLLNDAGQTAFYSRLAGSGVDTSNDDGIWSERSGSLALVARSGNQAPARPAA